MINILSDCIGIILYIIFCMYQCIKYYYRAYNNKYFWSLHSFNDYIPSMTYLKANQIMDLCSELQPYGIDIGKGILNLNTLRLFNKENKSLAIITTCRCCHIISIKRIKKKNNLYPENYHKLSNVNNIVVMRVSDS